MQVRGHGLQVGGHDMHVGGHDVQVRSHDMQVRGHGMQVRGHDMQVSGHGKQVRGHDMQTSTTTRWLQATLEALFPATYVPGRWLAVGQNMQQQNPMGALASALQCV
eukprot:460784-Pelagomonas_calceolata.AAC.1